MAGVKCTSLLGRIWPNDALEKNAIMP